MPATTICMANFKGGVGKSTSAVNLAAGLNRLGNRVLLVDVDPQANASEMWLDEATIKHDFRSLIVDRVPLEEVIVGTRLNGLDLLPATIELSRLDKELVVTPNGPMRIEKALRSVLDQYDYLIFDTGPNLSHLTLGALAASRYLVIPVSAAVWSTRGLSTFLGWIEEHREDEVVQAELLGVIATMVSPQTRVGKGLLEDIAASELPSFRTWIPRKIRAEDAVLDRLVTGDPGMDRSLSLAYADLAAEVAATVASKGGSRHARQ